MANTEFAEKEKLDIFDCRQIVHSRVMPTRHLVKLVMAPHVNKQESIRSMYMMWQMLEVLMVSMTVMSVLECSELSH